MRFYLKMLIFPYITGKIVVTNCGTKRELSCLKYENMAYKRNTNKKITLKDIRGRNIEKDTLNRDRKTAVCGHCKHEFYTSNMKRCPHPVVQKACGPWICYYCCRKCRHGQRVGSGVKCVYPEIRNTGN